MQEVLPTDRAGLRGGVHQAEHHGELFPAQPAIAVAVDQQKQIPKDLMGFQPRLLMGPAQKSFPAHRSLRLNQSPEPSDLLRSKDAPEGDQHLFHFRWGDLPVSVEIEQGKQAA